MMTAVCRDCAALWEAPPGGAAGRCPQCGGRRTFGHPELASLSLAHIDCDAFYASVEKRDNPAIAGRPVIVGGGRRGVVAACCYIARISGVRSAMPMFQALKRCPKAVVIRPDMEKYQRVGHQIRALMQDLTPLVEPLSIDEAFLDLAGTQALAIGEVEFQADLGHGRRSSGVGGNARPASAPGQGWRGAEPARPARRFTVQ